MLILMIGGMVRGAGARRRSRHSDRMSPAAEPTSLG
jgi:hypothetical protein